MPVNSTPMLMLDWPGLLSDLQVERFVHKQLIHLISTCLLCEYLYKRYKGSNRTGRKEPNLIIS